MEMADKLEGTEETGREGKRWDEPIVSDALIIRDKHGLPLTCCSHYKELMVSIYDYD